MWTPTKLLRPILWQVILVDSMLDKVEVVPNPASRSDDRDAEAAAVRVLTRFPHDAVLHTRTSSVQQISCVDAFCTRGSFVTASFSRGWLHFCLSDCVRSEWSRSDVKLTVTWSADLPRVMKLILKKNLCIFMSISTFSFMLMFFGFFPSSS